MCHACRRWGWREGQHRLSRGMPLTFSRMRPSRPSSLFRMSAAPVPMKPGGKPHDEQALACCASMRVRPALLPQPVSPASSPFGPLSLLRCCPIIHSRLSPAAPQTQQSAMARAGSIRLPSRPSATAGQLTNVVACDGQRRLELERLEQLAAVLAVGAAEQVDRALRRQAAGCSGLAPQRACTC